MKKVRSLIHILWKSLKNFLLKFSGKYKQELLPLEDYENYLA